MQRTSKNRDNVFIWAIVLLAIYIFYFKATALSLFFRPITDSIHYGEYILQKSFLLVIGLGIFAYYLWPFKTFGKQIRKHVVPIVIIVACLLLAHFLSFGRWFYSEDYRVLQDRLSTGQILCCGGTGYYSLMPILVVARYFGANFALYNGLGLFIYLLIGVTIFFFLNLIQNNKIISLIAALFFVTSSGYFLQMVMMTEFIGDGVSLLLFMIAIYLLVGRFYAGSVIVAAGALEFGLSRTYFIALPLFITGLLFTLNIKNVRISQIISFIAFPLLSLLYMPVFFHFAMTKISSISVEFLKLSAMILAVSIPYEFTYPLIQIFQLFIGNSFYIAPLLGILFVISIILLTLFSYKKNILAAKLFLVGIVIIVGSVLVPSVRATERLVQDVGSLTSQFVDNIPTNYTGYGIFPPFGASLIVAGITLLFQSRKIKIALFLIIIFNIVASIQIEGLAIQRFAKPQLEINKQLINLLPADGKQKIIFVPYSPANNSLYADIDKFYAAYYPKEPVIETDDPKAFLKLLEKYSPIRNHIYLFVRYTNSNKIYDFSPKLRAIPKEKLPDALGDLMREAKSPYDQ